MNIPSPRVNTLVSLVSLGPEYQSQSQIVRQFYRRRSRRCRCRCREVAGCQGHWQGALQRQPFGHRGGQQPVQLAEAAPAAEGGRAADGDREAAPEAREHGAGDGQAGGRNEHRPVRGEG